MIRWSALLTLVVVVVAPLVVAGCTVAKRDGKEGGPCYGNDTCDDGLACSAGTCIDDDDDDDADPISDFAAQANAVCQRVVQCQPDSGQSVASCVEQVSSQVSRIEDDARCSAYVDAVGAFYACAARQDCSFFQSSPESGACVAEFNRMNTVQNQLSGICFGGEGEGEEGEGEGEEGEGEEGEGEGNGTCGDGVVGGVARQPLLVDATELVVGDVDGDGDDDLVARVRDATGETNVTLFVDGGEIFPGPGRRVIGSQPQAGMRLADIDGDGDLDLVSGTFFGFVRVFIGDGDGGFAEEIDVPLPGSAAEQISRFHDVVDIDADGDLDLVGATFDTGTIDVALNDGAGGFGAPTALASGLDGPDAVANGDLDGDGDVDLAVAVFNSGDVALLLNDGSGAFAAPRLIELDGTVATVSVVDIDDDSDLDLLIPVVNGPELLFTIARNDGDGAFVTSVLDLGDDAITAVADVDVDGRSDLVLVGTADGTLAAFTVDADNNLDARLFADPGRGGQDRISALTVIDIDNDGFDDVVALASSRFREPGDGKDLVILRARPLEECDDGNPFDGDGCSPTCTVER